MLVGHDTGIQHKDDGWELDDGEKVTIQVHGVCVGH